MLPAKPINSSQGGNIDSGHKSNLDFFLFLCALRRFLFKAEALYLGLQTRVPGVKCLHLGLAGCMQKHYVLRCNSNWHLGMLSVAEVLHPSL